MASLCKLLDVCALYASVVTLTKRTTPHAGLWSSPPAT